MGKDPRLVRNMKKILLFIIPRLVRNMKKLLLFIIWNVYIFEILEKLVTYIEPGPFRGDRPYPTPKPVVLFCKNFLLPLNFYHLLLQQNLNTWMPKYQNHLNIRFNKFINQMVKVLKLVGPFEYQ